MLKIKMGFALHIDYTFEVISDVPNRSGTYVFITNDISDQGLLQVGKDNFLGDMLFGSSDREVENASSVLIPVARIPFGNTLPVNTLTQDTVNKTFTLKNTVSVTASNFKVRAGSVLTFREFALENISRIVLSDNFQGLDGIVVGSGDKIKITAEFNYTYYTNNRIATLSENVFGTRVDYSSEVLRLQDMSVNGVQLNPGYASDNPMDIFPITSDIRGVDTASYYPPVANEYQQKWLTLDESERRIDELAIGYSPVKTSLYGFILRDNIRGLGVLVRFSSPVILEAEKRYEVGGYIQWGRTIGDSDEGYVTVDVLPPEEEIGTTVNIGGSITTIPPTDEVAIEVTSLKDLKIVADRLGLVVDLANTTTWAAALAKLKTSGVFSEIDLYSNRIGSRKPSLLQYTAPSAAIHKAYIDSLTELNGDYVIAPALIVGGDYNSTTAANAWRWDCYFPFMGAFEGTRYLAYVCGQSNDAHTAIAALPSSLQTSAVISVRTENVYGNINVSELKGLDLALLEITAGTSHYIPYAQVINLNSAANEQFSVEYLSDFDTPTYDDWVSGKSTLNINAIPLDLRTPVESDNRKNVTSFTIVVDSVKHKNQSANLWIDGTNYGKLSTLKATDLAAHGITVTSSVSGTRSSYVFARPFNKAIADFLDVCIINDVYGFSNGPEIGYITINAGTHGRKVYSPVAADISNALTSGDNAFLMCGVRLFQPLPDYLFKTRILSAAEASAYYGTTIASVLPTSLFDTSFENNLFQISYNKTLSWKDSLLNGNHLYPAIGVDLTRIGDNIADDTVIFVDSTWHEWTKAELMAAKTTTPNKIIDNVYYFVTPFQLTAGASIYGDRLDSEFYDQYIQLNATIAVAVEYPIESAMINPNPLNLNVGDSSQAAYTFEPEQAVVTSEAWSVVDSSIATVSEFGLVTGLRQGTTTLRLVLNTRVVATSVINVADRELVITCDGAENITTCLDINAEQAGLSINEVDVLAERNGNVIYEYFRDAEDFRIVNCHNFTELDTETAVSETGFMRLSGTYDLFVNGTLLAKDLSEEQIQDYLNDQDTILIIEDGDF